MPERSDPFAALGELAPTVDMAASRDLFQRSRSTHGEARTRWMLPAAVVTLLIAGLIGVWAIARDDDSSTIPVSPADVGNYEVLLVAASRREESGTIDVATDARSLSAALEPVTGSDDVSVDLERSIMAVFTIAGNACPPEIGGFDVDGATWTPRFAYGTEPCNDIGITWAYVVAFDRDSLGDSVSFTLPVDTLDGFTGGLDEPGPEHREMIAIDETTLPFGTILAATDEIEAGAFWTSIRGGDPAFAPFVDFDRRYLVAFTLPDDACPDQLVQFRSGDDADENHIIWEPQFEPPPGGCEQPLITRTYVIAIDRPAIDVDVTFRLPGDETFGYETNELTVAIARASIDVRLDGGDSGDAGQAIPDEPDLIATDVTLPLPPIGEPRLHTGTFGIVWVVQHDDGTVSVVDAVVPAVADEDEGGVVGLGHLVRPTENGTGFAGQQYLWDAHGRTLNGPRSADLVGYAGTVVDAEVLLFTSNATAIDGEPDELDTAAAADADADVSNLPLIGLDVLPTFSFLGPIWRQLDATLVVEGGIGRLCDIDVNAAVPDLATCGDDALDTAITSANGDITSWFFGPVLAEFDDFGNIITVAPLGGRASRNESAQGSDARASGDGWRLITSDARPVEGASLPMIAVDPASLTALEATYSSGALDVDLDESVVLAIPAFGNSCPPVLRQVDIGEGVIDARFGRTPATSCDDVGITYGFVIAIDRAASPDPVTVLWTNASGVPTDGEATYDLTTGEVLAGGLVFPEFEWPFVDCSSSGAGSLDLVLTLESAVDREATVLLRAGDGTELGEFSAELRQGVNEVRLALGSPIIDRLDGDAFVSSDSPPAVANRPLLVSTTDIDEATRQCRE